LPYGALVFFIDKNDKLKMSIDYYALKKTKTKITILCFALMICWINLMGQSSLNELILNRGINEFVSWMMSQPHFE